MEKTDEKDDLVFNLQLRQRNLKEADLLNDLRKVADHLNRKTLQVYNM